MAGESKRCVRCYSPTDRADHCPPYVPSGAKSKGLTLYQTPDGPNTARGRERAAQNRARNTNR